jgi:thioredoxin-dependent peroxiredoxin
MERASAVTMKGNPLTLVGPELKVGDKAPAFTMIDRNMKPVSLSDSAGKVRLLSVLLSLDTGICNTQTKKFDEALSSISGVKSYAVSVDLPFTQGKFCGENKTDNFEFLTDHRDVSFATAYGLLVKELRVLARSVIVIDKNDRISYIQVLPEIAAEPDYDKAIAAVQAAVKS